MMQTFSVTRFGEIVPIWYNFKSLGQKFEGLFSIWQNVDPTEAQCFTIGQFFIVADDQTL